MITPATIEDRRRMVMSDLQATLEREGQASMEDIQSAIRRNTLELEPGKLDLDDRAMLGTLVFTQIQALRKG